jgi:hypothetical protein
VVSSVSSIRLRVMHDRHPFIEGPRYARLLPRKTGYNFLMEGRDLAGWTERRLWHGFGRRRLGPCHKGSRDQRKNH